MDLHFYKMCPSGNTTLLIHKPHISPELRAPMANILMDPLHLQAEQVAYVDMESTPPRIAMMGGEFCGNACRSFAAMLAMLVSETIEDVTSHNAQNLYEGIMLSSGTNAPVAYRVSHTEKGLNAAIRMPNTTMPSLTFVHIDHKKAPIVHLDGIDHLLLDQNAHAHNPEKYESLARNILGEHGLLHSVAAGCIWYHYDAATGQCAIHPFVHVRETQSLYAETACGSGTLALALYLAGMTRSPEGNESSKVNKNKSFTLNVMQPSGMVITATCHAHHDEKDIQNGAFKASPTTSSSPKIEAWIGGSVTCIARGISTIDM